MRRSVLLWICVGLHASAVGGGASAAAKAAPAPAARRPAPLRDLGKKHKVRLVYFVAADRQPTRAWREKIGVAMAFVNDLFVTSLRDRGHKTRGLDFEFGKAGKLEVHLVRGRHKAAHYNGAPKYDAMNQWRTVLPEVRRALGPASRRMFVIFAETYDPGRSRFEWPGGVALGARFSAVGGVGLFSAWVLQDLFAATTIDGQLELLADTTPIKGRKALGCHRGNSPRFEFIEDGFGAVAHELGHALGLWHDHRKGALYVMGNGFRTLRRNYIPQPAEKAKVCFSPDNTRMLAYSRLLADGLDLSDGKPPFIRLTHPTTLPVGARRIDVSVEVRDDKALAAGVCFCSRGDTVVWGRPLTGRRAEVKIGIDIRPAEAGEIRLHFGAIDAGGNFARANATIPVKKPAP